MDEELRGLLRHALDTGELDALTDYLIERSADPDVARAVRENVIRELGGPFAEEIVSDVRAITTNYPPGSLGALIEEIAATAARADDVFRALPTGLTYSFPPMPEEPPPPPDYGPNRCEVCGWTLARTAEDGCVPGNCSYRPADGSLEAARIRNRRAELARRDAP